MTNQELVDKLNICLKDINEIFSLGDLGLLKAEELYSTKYRIEDELESYKSFFEKIESLKIEKCITPWRSPAKTGIFLSAEQANSSLRELHILLQELIKAKGGSEQVLSVALPNLKTTGSTINQAIEDAKALLVTQGATSALDRVHTVLHGYLKNVCKDAEIIYSEEVTLNQLLNTLKKSHPALVNRNENTDQILKSLANILDKLNPLRNNSSLAHSNDTLLDHDEAMIVINTVNTILSYLDSKLTKK